MAQAAIKMTTDNRFCPGHKLSERTQWRKEAYFKDSWNPIYGPHDNQHKVRQAKLGLYTETRIVKVTTIEEVV